MTPEIKERIEQLVMFIFEQARRTDRDLTGIGRLRICEQNVEQLIRDVLGEHERR